MMAKRELIYNYLEANVAPMLVSSFNGNDFKNAVIIPASIDTKELNGHYEDINFVALEWFNKLLNSNNNLLVIDKIDTLSKEEQLNFKELLKYRKISTFLLPKACRIIITADKINNTSINEEIFSLVAVL